LPTAAALVTLLPAAGPVAALLAAAGATAALLAAALPAAGPVAALLAATAFLASALAALRTQLTGLVIPIIVVGAVNIPMLWSFHGVLPFRRRKFGQGTLPAFISQANRYLTASRVGQD
jgi:hypothetical protein